MYENIRDQRDRDCESELQQDDRFGPSYQPIRTTEEERADNEQGYHDSAEWLELSDDQ